MDFSFLRISGEDFGKQLRAYAPNDTVGAYLSHSESDAYAVMLGADRVGTLKTSDGVLSAFFTSDNRTDAARHAFAAAVKTLKIHSARVITADSRFLSLCLGMSDDIETETCLYALTAPRTYPYIPLRPALSPNDLPSAAPACELGGEMLKDLIRRRAVYVGEECFCIADTCNGYGAAFISAFAPDDSAVSALLCRMGMFCRDCNMLALSLCRESASAPLETAGFACTERVLRVRFK